MHPLNHLPPNSAFGFIPLPDGCILVWEGVRYYLPPYRASGHTRRTIEDAAYGDLFPTLTLKKARLQEDLPADLVLTDPPKVIKRRIIGGHVRRAVAPDRSLTCPHCYGHVTPQSYLRYHGDRCFRAP